jgi:hypothetical protein
MEKFKMSNTKEILKHFFGPKAIISYTEYATLIICGFLVGYNYHRYKLVKKETVNQQTTVTQVTSDIQNKVANTQDVNSSYTEKFFNRKGVLVHEIEKKHENRASDLSFTNHTDLSEVNSQVTSATFSTIETSYQSTWLLGFSVPLKLQPNFRDVDFQIGYRLLGPIYVTGRSDYRFSEPRVGFLINF